MAAMDTIVTIAGIGVLLAGGWYAYKKGYLDDITGLIGGLGGGNGEPAPEGEGEAETPATPKAKEEEKKEPATGAEEEEDKPAASGSSGDCKTKFGGKCTQECADKASSQCKECEKACGSSSSLALAYMGSFYDGEVLDKAYYVTRNEPSSFIPRRSSNYGIAIA
jgi:FKBP-type peptidyl-prolyl cis-trans isomerase